jgi:hypothetical protein
MIDEFDAACVVAAMFNKEENPKTMQESMR